MKIVQVLFSGLGGHGSVAFSLVRGDLQKSHRHGMVFYGIEPFAHGYAESCAELDVSYAVVRKRRGFDLASWRAVIRELRAADPDVVILHSMPLVFAVSAFTRLSRVPLIAVDHLSVHMKRAPDWSLLSAAQLLAERTVVLTPEFHDEVRDRLGPLYRAGRVHVIGNGIDVDLFEAAEPRSRAPLLRVGMHSRFSPSKDHATLIRATAAVDNVRLVLAGDGETMPSLRALTRELGVEDRVDFLGMLAEEELPAYLRSLDIYVQSSFGEAMSTAVMQAMASALPVLASDVGGLRNMVRPGETGELFPYGSARELAALLRSLAGDPARRATLGRVAREHARRSWSHEQMFRRYEALAMGAAGAASRKTSA